MILFHMLDSFCLSRFFPSITLINYASSYRKRQCGPINNARDKLEYRDKWSKIVPSHLLNEHGNLSLLLFFLSNQCLVENIQGKFQKNISVTFISLCGKIMIFPHNVIFITVAVFHFTLGCSKVLQHRRHLMA